MEAGLAMEGMLMGRLMPKLMLRGISRMRMDQGQADAGRETAPKNHG